MHNQRLGLEQWNSFENNKNSFDVRGNFEYLQINF